MNKHVTSINVYLSLSFDSSEQVTPLRQHNPLWRYCNLFVCNGWVLLPSLKLTVRPWKSMGGRWISFWVGINLPKLKDSFKQMVEVMLGGVFFSLPISRAGRTRSCPVLPKFVARTGQTVDGISQSKSSTWFSLCILWLPILLQGSIEGSTLPWSLKTSTSGRAFGGNLPRCLGHLF